MPGRYRLRAEVVEALRRGFDVGLDAVSAVFAESGADIGGQRQPERGASVAPVVSDLRAELPDDAQHRGFPCPDVAPQEQPPVGIEAARQHHAPAEDLGYLPSVGIREAESGADLPRRLHEDPFEEVNP